MENLLSLDKKRRGNIPCYQRSLRHAGTYPPPISLMFRALHRIFCFLYKVEIAWNTKIGPGLYIGHPYCITINPKAVIGKNCNIHRGVLIGQENRGRRKGTPVIGDCVWIGINSTLVGKITIGDDVLIAPNSYVNCDIPSHSVVFGNPCIIKHRENATENYINHRI